MSRLFIVFAFLAGFALANLAPQAAFAQPQTVVYVDATSTNTAAPSGGNPGDSWTTNVPYKYLQNGIQRAVALSGGTTYVEIHVRGATGAGLKYYPDEGNGQSNNSRTSHFQLNHQVTILGNYIGTGGSPDTRDPTYLTILSGDITQDNTLDNDNAYHVVRAAGGLALNTNETPHIDGCRIEAGNADDTGNETGGGVHVASTADAYIRDCTITANRSDSEGGGIYCTTTASLTLRNSRVTDNETGGFGGGVSTGSGGVLVAPNTTFSGNTAALNGGAIFGTRTPDITLVDCRLDDNSTASNGGAIAVVGASGNLTNLTIISSLLTNNAADGDGGAIYVDASATMAMRHCTLDANDADGLGSGLAHFGGTCEIFNSIYWQNDAGSAGDEIFTDNSVSATRTDIRARLGAGVSGAVSFTDCLDADPLYAGGGDYHLDCGSPCINAGLDAAVALDDHDVDEDSITTGEDAPDLDLLRRRVMTTDLGVYERPSEVCCPADTNGDFMININDLPGGDRRLGTVLGACPANVGPIPCGDNVVNINDLLAVIILWDTTCPGCGEGEAILMSFEMAECLEDCDNLYEFGSSEWLSCITDCQETWGD